MIEREKMQPPAPVEVCSALLERCKRDHVPLRRSLIQSASGGAAALAAFVSGRRETALDLYLLLHASACGGDFGTRLHALVWARALGLGESTHATSLVSRNWRWLESLGLITRGRDRRLLKVTLLKEDLSREPYAHPAKAGNYFKLDHGYWLEEWHRRLDLPAKAALLILLSRRPHSELPQEQAPAWFGISADTLGRGLRTLQREQLVQTSVLQKQAPLSPVGYRWEQRYSREAPFARVSPGKAPVT